MSEEDLYIAFWDGTQWQALDSQVNAQTGTVTASITHFSTYGVLGEVTLPPPPEVKETPTPTPSSLPGNLPADVPSPSPTVDQVSEPAAASPEPQSPSTAPVSTGEPEPSPSINWLLIGGICAAVVLVGIFFVARRKRPAPDKAGPSGNGGPEGPDLE
jgi:hypothetical protein